MTFATWCYPTVLSDRTKSNKSFRRSVKTQLDWLSFVIPLPTWGIGKITRQHQLFVSLRCSDFSGGWPEGRPVTIEIQDGAAWTASGGELPVPASVTVENRTVTVDCTTVPVRDFGFSTLKSRHVGRGGDR